VIDVREVTDPSDPALAAFGEIQVRAYPDPGSLIPPRYFPYMIAPDDGPRENHIIVAEDDGRVVGGSVFHFLRPTAVGFSSFLAVDLPWRGRGVARRLHEARFAVLDRAAGGRSRGVFIDVVSPGRLTPRELERERAVGSDPWDRRRAFQALGFRRVAVRYEQPLGGPNGGPVTNLDLLFCPREPAASVPTEFVIRSLLAYWSGWLGEERSRAAAAELRERAGGRDEIGLEPADAPA
jgi:GNAT superfamily N-acetyltransferase